MAVQNPSKPASKAPPKPKPQPPESAPPARPKKKKSATQRLTDGVGSAARDARNAATNLADGTQSAAHSAVEAARRGAHELADATRQGLATTSRAAQRAQQKVREMARAGEQGIGHMFRSGFGGERPAPTAPQKPVTAGQRARQNDPASRTTPIPDVEGLMALARTGAISHIEANHGITNGYGEFARKFQGIVDPTFNGHHSAAKPNWFAFTPHASDTAGQGMRAAAAGRDILNMIPSKQGAYDLVGLHGPARQVAEAAREAFRARGLPEDVATAFGAVTSGMNLRALEDPRTLGITTGRMMDVYNHAPGSNPKQKALAVTNTLDNLLAEGNRDIYTDVAGSGAAYLKFRQGAGAPMTPERVLNDFHLPGSNAADARRAYQFGLDHAADRQQPFDFQRQLAGVDGQSMAVATFALYENAGKTTDPARRDQLITMGNNMLAYREQHDAVQPAFTPGQAQPGEVDRSALMQALTPGTRLPIGNSSWNFSDWANRQPGRDSNPLTSKPTEYNWANFNDRFPAIIDAFQTGYNAGDRIWSFPEY